MSNVKSDRIPCCGKHKPTGQARVVLNGRSYYLGKWKSPEAKEAYNRLIAEWLARDRQLSQSMNGLSVNELIVAYFSNHAVKHYRKPDGTPTRQLELIRLAMRPLKELYGQTPAANFGPLALQTVRQRMVEKGTMCRGTVNEHVAKIKRLFKWGVANELVPSSVFHGLQAVAGLQKNRCEAREPQPIKPVPEDFVEAVLAHVGAQVNAMIQIQLLTACRPAEVCLMRSCDFDMSGRIWIYRPESHKTEYLGLNREIYIGPRAQKIIKPWLKPNLQAFLFSPEEAREERFRGLRAKRKTCVQPSQVNRRKKKPQRLPGEFYDSHSYRRAIHRACETAGVPKWSPNRLRHNAATRLRKEFGVELARIILGHATAFTTEIYAEADRQQAMEVVAKIG